MAETDDEDVDVFDDTETAELSDTEYDWAVLQQTDLLSPEEAEAVIHWRGAKIIALVGERMGGKTTLVTTLYERFLRGAFADHFFAQSWTLSGFDHRNFESRARSGLLAPDTPRTSRQDGVRFFHLCAAPSANLGSLSNLLISERAGESYREARDTPAKALELLEIRKADVIAFVVDGERVSSARLRAEAFASVRNSLRAFLDAEAIPDDAEIQIITTKYDELMPDSMVECVTALEKFEKNLRTLFEKRVSLMSFWHIAARDPKGRVEPAWGMDELVKGWFSKPSVVQPKTISMPPLESEFDQYLRRHNPGGYSER